MSRLGVGALVAALALAAAPDPGARVKRRKARPATAAQRKKDRQRERAGRRIAELRAEIALRSPYAPTPNAPDARRRS